MPGPKKCINLSWQRLWSGHYLRKSCKILAQTLMWQSATNVFQLWRRLQGKLLWGAVAALGLSQVALTRSQAVLSPSGLPCSPPPACPSMASSATSGGWRRRRRWRSTTVCSGCTTATPSSCSSSAQASSPPPSSLAAPSPATWEGRTWHQACCSFFNFAKITVTKHFRKRLFTLIIVNCVRQAWWRTTAGSTGLTPWSTSTSRWSGKHSQVEEQVQEQR